MNLDLLQNLQVNRNRILRAGTQLLTIAPSDPVLGEQLFFDTGAATSPLNLAIYDGISQGTPVSTWRVLAGANRNDSVSGLWTWNPGVRGTGTGNGERAPFVLGANCLFDTGAGNHLRNWTPNLNADLLDGRHTLEWADAVPSQFLIPVYGAAGRLAVGDAVTDYDAVNRKTLLAAATGLVALAPCKAATTVRFAGTRTTNTITASSNGAFIPDGYAIAVGERVLLKDQQTGGSGVDNGIYTVTTVGSAGAAAVLTRASDADATGELVVGALVFIEAGDTLKSTQWSCQRPAGTGGGSIITINTDVQLWQKTFQQSAYAAGRGLVLSGLEFNFCQALDYTIGSVFWADGLRTVKMLAPPVAASPRFLSHSGTVGTGPAWSLINVTDIGGWPNPILPGTPRTAKRHARFGTDTSSVEDANLADAATGILCPENSVLSPTVGLGDVTHPFGFLWTSLLRLKPSAGSGAVLNVLGIQDTGADANTDHKQVVTWGVAAMKAWLGYSTSDIGGVPTATTLTFTNGTGFSWAINTQTLAANRTWDLALDFSVFNGKYVTVDTVQNVTATKKFGSPTSDPSASMLEIHTTAGSATPFFKFTAGGNFLVGDGASAPVGQFDFVNNRMRFSGKGVEFAANSIVRLTSAQASSGAPTFVLGLDANDDVRRVNVADLGTYTGLPALAINAVGYGDATGKLAGDATNFRWDYTNKRLGLKMTPTETLDVTGSFRQYNTITSGSLPGGQIGFNDTSNSSVDWTSRAVYGLWVSAQKSGTATFVTSAAMTAINSVSSITAGSMTTLYSVRSVLSVGAASSGPTVTDVFGFWSGVGSAAGSSGSIAQLVHFQANNLPGACPQPGEHYGLRVPQLTSLTGATRTAALRLDLTTSGVGERYNIYVPGNAVNYLAGNLGLGVTTPTARLEFTAGTTTVAPIAFSAISNAASLLTTPLAGSFESRGDRLTFTDTTPTRHILAFLDDVSWTNDTAAAPGGGLVCDSSTHMVAALDPANSIGQNDFTFWARFRVPTGFRGPTLDGICGIGTSAAVGSTYVNAAKLQINSAGQLQFMVSTSTTDTRTVKTTASVIATYGGKIIDVVVARKGSAVPVLWINAIAQTATETTGGGAPAWDVAVDSLNLHAGIDGTGYGSVPEIYRVCFFNFALTISEAADLSRYGRVDTQDKWGSMAVKVLTNPGFESFSAGSPTGWIKGGSVGTADEAADFHGGAHSVRFTAGGFGGITSANWLYQSCLTALKRHVARAWAKRVSGTGPLILACGYGGAGMGSVAGTITSAAAWTQFGGQFKADGDANGLHHPFLAFSGSTSGDVFLIDDVTCQQVGCIADMDFAVGCGTTIPDRSGRYPGTITGFYEHLISTCPTEVTVGGGTVSRNLRRFTSAITAKDNDTVTVTHNLGTQNLTVAVWNAAGASVAVAVNRKTGNDTNAVELGFALVGAPSVAVNFLVVIIG